MSSPSKEKPRLTEQEKKNNHIASEQKRRQAIREGFDRLASQVPNMEGQGRSESLVLRASLTYLKEQLEDYKRLKSQCELAGIDIKDVEIPDMEPPISTLSPTSPRSMDSSLRRNCIKIIHKQLSALRKEQEGAPLSPSPLPELRMSAWTAIETCKSKPAGTKSYALLTSLMRKEQDATPGNSPCATPLNSPSKTSGELSKSSPGDLQCDDADQDFPWGQQLQQALSVQAKQKSEPSRSSIHAANDAASLKISTSSAAVSPLMTAIPSPSFSPIYRFSRVGSHGRATTKEPTLTNENARTNQELSLSRKISTTELISMFDNDLTDEKSAMASDAKIWEIATTGEHALLTEASMNVEVTSCSGPLEAMEGLRSTVVKRQCARVEDGYEADELDKESSLDLKCAEGTTC